MRQRFGPTLFVAAFAGAALLASCSGGGGGVGAPREQGGNASPADAGRSTQEPWLARHERASAPGTYGAALFVYKMRHTNGDGDPFSGSEPSTFNQSVYGGATPNPKFLLGSSSTYGGNAGVYTELTNVPLSQQYDGVTLVTCQGAFPNIAPSGECLAASGSVVGPSRTRVREFVAVQSWPFYVGASASSNLVPGRYGFTTDSDDGSYITIGPAPFTYAQSGNFQGATGLSAGSAVVNNGGEHAPATENGSVTIAADTCAGNVYWLTFEWYELVGGLSGGSYAWTLPGGSSFTQVTQSVLWGQVTQASIPVSGATVSIHTKGTGNVNLTTDANGCYGYNYEPLAATANATVTATVASTQQTQKASVSNGNVSVVNFAF